MKRNLISSLKKLLKAFGKETNSSNAVDLIDQVADTVNGKVLPETTAEDVGKAVVVSENGEYALGEAGKGPVIATIYQAGPNWTISKTYNELLEACEAGNIIFREFDGNYSRHTTTNYETHISPTDKDIDVYFYDDTRIYWFRLSEDGTITRTVKQFTFTS